MDIKGYCQQSDAQILSDILQQRVPRAVLTDPSGWKRLCQVRGRHATHVAAAVWQHLCAQRGLRSVPRPRGRPRKPR